MRAALDQLVDATPRERDRVMDFLRAASIVSVVLGHWLIATATREDGSVETTTALADLPALRPVTWIFQVIAVFFVVGGFSNLRSLRADSGGSTDWAGFLARRADRLLRPTVLFAVVWLPLAALLTRLVDDEALSHDVARIAAQPLWFLAVYLVVVLVAPVQAIVHRHQPYLVLVLLPLVVVALDALRLNDVAPDVAQLNYLAVFLFAQELGFWYADGRFQGARPRSAAAVGVGGLLLLVLLTAAGPYPVSMIGLPGQRFSNMSPPTVCILVLTVAQCALLLAVHDPLQRWLERSGPWRATVVVNLVVLTLFLWHLTALILAGGGLLAIGLDLPDIGTAAWWLHRLLWIGSATIVLAGLVAVFSPVERFRGAATTFGPGAVRVFGYLLAFAGLAGFALAGFANATQASGRDLFGVRFSPLAAVALLVAGWLLAAGVPRLPARPPADSGTG